MTGQSWPQAQCDIVSGTCRYTVYNGGQVTVASDSVTLKISLTRVTRVLTCVHVGLDSTHGAYKGMSAL